MDEKLYRILDANYNRAKEALRVTEDIVRFILEDTKLTTTIKNIRHTLTDILSSSKLLNSMIEERDSESDIGKKTDKLEMKRNGTKSLLNANFQRAKESLRVLEEISKILCEREVHKFKKLRYNCYSAEKDVEKKWPSLSDN